MRESNSILQVHQYHYLRTDVLNFVCCIKRTIYAQVIVNTSLADLKPYVLDTPIGSQIKQRRKSTNIKHIENLNTFEYTRGGK
jgi:ATP-dependent helicase/DNAse subunit B